jgi:hypothetical protein
MSCLAPYKGVFRCGSCLPCKIKRINTWSVRLMHELASFDGKGVFVTLTYKELYEGQSVEKKELQDFFKLLRYHLKGRKIKYFSCGEYGERYQRPHYHAIIFGLDIFDSELITEVWQKKPTHGFVKVGTVTPASCKYVVGYINKWSKVDLPVNLNKPFQLISQGFGKDYALEHSDFIHKHLAILKDGKEVPIPRYYRKKLDISFNADEYPVLAQRLSDKIRDRWSDLDYLQNCLFNFNPRFLSRFIRVFTSIRRDLDEGKLHVNKLKSDVVKLLLRRVFKDIMDYDKFIAFLRIEFEKADRVSASVLAKQILLKELVR